MESQPKEKRSKVIQLMTLSAVLAYSATLAGCSESPSSSLNKKAGSGLKNKKDSKDEEKESSTGYGGVRSGSGWHFFSGTSANSSSSASRTRAGGSSFGSVSRGFFGSFHFSGG